MNNLHIARKAFRVGYQEFLGIWGWQSWIGGWMLNVVSQVTFFALLGKLIGSEEQFQFLLIGYALASGCYQANIACTASTWDRWDGTYPLLVIAPASLVPAIVGRTSPWLIGGAASSTLALVIVHIAFGLPVAWPEILLLPAFVLVCCFGSFALATAVGSIIARRPEVRNFTHRLITIAIMTFSGVGVPVAFWPGWIEALAQILPVTHGLTAVRQLLAGEASSATLEQLALEVLVGIGWLTVAAVLIDRLADGGRRDGSIELI
jgi:ABC-2 type transport system permease protein